MFLRILRNKKFLAILFLLFFIFSIFSVTLCFRGSFSPKNLYQRDLVQYYLTSKIAKEGGKIYEDNVISHKKYFNRDVPYVLSNPPAVTPFLVSFLTLIRIYKFTFKTFSIFWFFLEVVFLFLSCFFMIKNIFQLNIKKSLFYSVGLFYLTFSFSDGGLGVFYGQLLSFLLLLFSFLYFSYKKNNELLSGFLLSLITVVKLFSFPFIILFLIKKKYHTIKYFFVFTLFFSLLTISKIGVSSFIDFYNSGKIISRTWNTVSYNMSFFSIPARLEAKTRFSPNPNIENSGGKNEKSFVLESHRMLRRENLKNQDIVNKGTFISLTVLALVSFFMFKTKDEDLQFVLALIISPFILPVTWPHYMVILVLPSMILVKKIVEVRSKKLLSFILSLIGVLSFVRVSNFVDSFRSGDFNIDYFFGLLLLVPNLIVLIVCSLLFYYDSKKWGL